MLRFELDQRGGRTLAAKMNVAQRHEEETMTRYRVTFFKRLTNSEGHQFKCPQGTVEVSCPSGTDGALEAAQREYERLIHLRHWSLHADCAEIEAVRDTAEDVASQGTDG